MSTKRAAAAPCVTGWVIKVEQTSRRCFGTTRAGEPCTNHGYAGWGAGDERYCYAHHPNEKAYRAEKDRIDEIIQAAARAAIEADLRAAEPS